MSTPIDPFRKRGDEAGEPSAYDQPLQGGYGAPPGHSPPGQSPGGQSPGGGAAQEYGVPPEHGQPQGYGAPQGYGQPQGYGAPQYGQPQYGRPPGYYPPAYGPQETAGRAIVVLVCAIASFVVLPVIPAVVALALAPGAKQEIASSGGRLGGEGMVQAGRIVAWINIALAVLVVVIAVIAIVVVASSGTTTTTGNA